MTLRCYIPTTLTALDGGLHTAHAIAPDAQGRGLRGEDLESLEFDALCIAAGMAAALAFESSVPAPSPRVVVAYDAAEDSPSVTLTPGFDLITLDRVEMNAVASFHLDEEEAWDEAVRLAEGGEERAVEDHLGESDLLWYDVSELTALLSGRCSE